MACRHSESQRTSSTLLGFSPHGSSPSPRTPCSPESLRSVALTRCALQSPLTSLPSQLRASTCSGLLSGDLRPEPWPPGLEPCSLTALASILMCTAHGGAANARGRDGLIPWPVLEHAQDEASAPGPAGSAGSAGPGSGPSEPLPWDLVSLSLLSQGHPSVSIIPPEPC